MRLGCCAAAHNLPAQTVPEDDDDGPIAEIILRPTVRGNLSVTIETWDAPKTSVLHVEALRRAAFPCDWKPDLTHDDMVSGTCRHYLATDGTLASGTLTLAPLVLLVFLIGLFPNPFVSRMHQSVTNTIASMSRAKVAPTAPPSAEGTAPLLADNGAQLKTQGPWR